VNNSLELQKVGLATAYRGRNAIVYRRIDDRQLSYNTTVIDDVTTSTALYTVQRMQAASW